MCTEFISVDLVTSCQSCQFRHRCNPTSHRFKVNLGSSYIEYNNSCIKAKIITLVVITSVGYYKRYCVEPTRALLVEKLKEHYMMKPLNFIARKLYWIFYK